MMHMPLDHIVIAVHDLEKTISDYTRMGFTVTPGGQHPGRTSHNALVVFEDGSYLELISWRAPAPEERWWQTLQAHGEGLVDFALLPHDTSSVLAGARARGLNTLNGPFPGARARPDGLQLQWQTARHTTPDVPFLCGDITPRHWRVPEDAGVRQHANGVTGVACIAVAVQDIQTSFKRYQMLVGERVTKHEHTQAPLSIPGWGVSSACVHLRSTHVMLLSPTQPQESVHEPLPAQELRQHLAQRGQGPYALTLRVAHRVAQPLDYPSLDLSHGVRFETWLSTTGVPE